MYWFYNDVCFSFLCLISHLLLHSVTLVVGTSGKLPPLSIFREVGYLSPVWRGLIPPARYIGRPSARQCFDGNALFRGWSMGFESPASESAGTWTQKIPPLLPKRYSHSLREAIHTVTGTRSARARQSDVRHMLFEALISSVEFSTGLSPNPAEWDFGIHYP